MASTKSSDPSLGLTADEQGMNAQVALLPYALLAFGVCLPIFVWVGGHAVNAAWMSASFAAFAVGWGVFYVAVNWLKTAAATNLRRRAQVQIASGIVWGLAVAVVAVFAHFAGPVRETLLLLALGASMICVAFTAPWLPSLLLVAPAVLAGPLIALFLHPEDLPTARLAMAAAALALALALLMNRVLRSQYALAAEREALLAERASQAEAARRLARSKSDLVSTLSDEIGNGLTGVAHVLASAARPGRTAPSRQQIGAALEAVNELLAILTTTVDAESAEAGRLTVEARPIDLAALVHDLIRLNRPAASAKGLELSAHVDPVLEDGRAIAVADPARARQVLAALIGNAVKFTVRGRVEVRVSLTADRGIAVAVADTGPGLCEEELAAALRPFERVARTSAGSVGAGLGLPLADQLARLMRGELRAESALGVGSCFTLELPFDPTAKPATAEPPTAPSEGPSRRLRILTVETDPLSAAMLRASLEQLGHQVVHAADGRRAVDLARVCDLDLVVADAPDTICNLRALAGAAGRTPVVALIGGEDGEAESALAAHADAILRRPVAVPSAARAIAEALAQRLPANDRQVA